MLPSIATTAKGLLLLSSLFFLCSFSGVPVEKTPITTQQKRLHKKELHLQKRLHQFQKHPKSKKRQQKVEKRLKKVQQVQQKNKNNSSYILGLLSMIAGIVAVFALLSSLVGSFVFAFSSGGFAIVTALLTLTFLLAIAGLVLGILHLIRRKKDAETYKYPGFAIIGIILSGIVLLLGIILIVAAFG